MYFERLTESSGIIFCIRNGLKKENNSFFFFSNNKPPNYTICSTKLEILADQECKEFELSEKHWQKKHGK